MLLVQFSAAEDSRIYMDFDKVDDALESLCRIFESVQVNKAKADIEKKKEGKVEYELSDLLKFLDSLYDLSVLM